MTPAIESYTEQVKVWPMTGRHILAQFDDNSIFVYQAYRPSIGRYVVEHGRFGGSEFGFSRMSWVKTNFLWMMHRSGWGMKENQEVTLALRLRRQFFDSILAEAVQSSYFEGHFTTRSVAASVGRIFGETTVGSGSRPVRNRARAACHSTRPEGRVFESVWYARAVGGN